jgi:DNA-binding response OmpR family regulator
MPHRLKILIIENDDFLRELLGNILHKKGFYIINGMTIAEALENAQGHKIHALILGTSCSDYQGKSSLNYIKQKLDSTPQEFIINDTNKKLTYIESDFQIRIKDLSVEKIIQKISQ